MAWHAKEVVRSIYEIPDADVAAEPVGPTGRYFATVTPR